MPVKLIDDKIWWDRARKQRGICDEVTQLRRAGHTVLLIAHFEKTLSEFEHVLRAQGQIVKRINLDPARTRSEDFVLCALAASLQPVSQKENLWESQKFQGQTPSDSSVLNILVVEHHPQRSKDEALIQAAEAASYCVELCFHIGLDDPLLSHYGVGSIQALGRKLGVDEETFLSNPMITRSIRQAQEKIEKQVPRDLPASSIEDWFRYNLDS